jgi:DNA-binding PadR family transcriptional regulator
MNITMNKVARNAFTARETFNNTQNAAVALPPRTTRERLVNQRRGLNKLQKSWIDPPHKDSGILWAKLPLDDLKSEWRNDLSINARRALDALICEHYEHAQKENGNLSLTHDQFKAAGVHRDYIKRVLIELETVGVISSKPGPERPHPLGSSKLYRLNNYNPDDKHPFAWATIAVMKSKAWGNLGINARRIMDRLLVENQKHPRGTWNGKLRVSYRQFKKLGIGDRLIGPALKELKDAGLVDIKKGEYSGLMEAPHLYRLTFLGTTEAAATWKPTMVCDAPIVEQKKPRRQSFKAKAAADFKAKVEAPKKNHSPPPNGEASNRRSVYGASAARGGSAEEAQLAVVAGAMLETGDFRPDDFTAVMRKGQWRVIDHNGNVVPTPGRTDGEGNPVDYFGHRLDAWLHIDKLRAVAAGEKINLGMEPVMKTIVRDVIDLTKRSSSKAHTPAGPLPTIEQAAAVVNEAQAATPASPASQTQSRPRSLCGCPGLSPRSPCRRTSIPSGTSLWSSTPSIHRMPITIGRDGMTASRSSALCGPNGAASQQGTPSSRRQSRHNPARRLASTAKTSTYRKSP